MKTLTSRRSFLKRTSAALSFPVLIPASALGRDGRPAPSNRIAMGFIGTGSHGVGRNLKMFLGNDDAQPVVLCDCDLSHLPRAVNEVKRKFRADHRIDQTQDWREVIARDDVDGVMISTPDHWHVPMSVAAMKAGKDVICEKPTLTVQEGRVQADVVKRYGAVFQTSTEDRAMKVYHDLAERVRNGRIGNLHTIRVTLPGNFRKGNPAPQPVPKGFDYNMWLGPAPEAPYTRDRCHYHFRWVSDYSGGILTDWGMHLLDTAQWANDTEHTGPVDVSAKDVKYFDDGLYDTAHTFKLEYTYANGVKLYVNSGGTGIRCEGDKGWIESASWLKPLTASDSKILSEPIRPEDIHLYTCREGEHRNFLDCVKSRKDPYFPAEIGHRCATIQHIGNICMKLGRALNSDPKAERFKDDETANRMLSRAMRAPWSL